MIDYERDGQPIMDIRAWAKSRGEKMVSAILHYRNAWTGEVLETPVSMPESFWNTLLMTPGCYYTFVCFEGNAKL